MGNTGMDADVLLSLTTLITSFSTAAMEMVQTVLPLAGPLVITIAVLFFGWRMFRAIARI